MTDQELAQALAMCRSTVARLRHEIDRLASAVTHLDATIRAAEARATEENT